MAQPIILTAPTQEQIEDGLYARLRSANGQSIYVYKKATIQDILKAGASIWQEAPTSGKPVLYRPMA